VTASGRRHDTVTAVDRDPIATFTRSLGDRPGDDFFADTGRRLLSRPSELTWPGGFSGRGVPAREGS
jgi:hypothetical protein